MRGRIAEDESLCKSIYFFSLCILFLFERLFLGLLKQVVRLGFGFGPPM